MAHISNEKGFKDKEEKKEVPGKKKTVKVDQNENKKKESEDKKSKEKENHVTEHWMKNLEMLELKSLDEMISPNH